MWEEAEGGGWDDAAARAVARQAALGDISARGRRKNAGAGRRDSRRSSSDRPNSGSRPGSASRPASGNSSSSDGSLRQGDGGQSGFSCEAAQHRLRRQPSIEIEGQFKQPFRQFGKVLRGGQHSQRGKLDGAPVS